MRKHNRKAIPFLLTVAMVITMFVSTPTMAFADTWDGSSSDTSWAGSGTAVDPYQITCAAELKGLADNVNSGTTYGGICFELTDDINLDNNAWTPIGGKCALSGGVPTGNYFAGTFDGSGKTISGLSVTLTAANQNAVGLFGYCNGGVIANLTVDGSVGTSIALEAIGGIVGYTNSSVANCTNNATVNCNNAYAKNIGGVAGIVENNATSGDPVMVQYCRNTGAVTGGTRVGGLLGAVYLGSSSQYKINVDRCYNTGTVTTVSSAYKSWIGGLVGYCKGLISSSYNSGQIVVAQGCGYGDGHRLGGITGVLNGYGAPCAKMENCYNIGDFSGGNDTYDQALYASADRNSGVIISDCYYLDTLSIDQATGSGWGTVTNVGALTAAQFTSGTNYFGGAFTYASGNYPEITWTKAYEDNPVDLQRGITAAATDSDDSTMIFLDGVNGSDVGAGTKESPVKTFSEALTLVTPSKNVIYVRDEVTIESGTQSWASSGTAVTVKRSSIYSGHLVDVTGGTLNLSDITLDGNTTNYNSALINVAGGALNIGSGTVLQNNKSGANGGALRLIGGTTTMTGGTITGCTAMAGAGAALLTDSAASTHGTLILSPSGGASQFQIADTIYLSDTRYLNIAAALSTITGNITINCSDPSVGRTVAQATSNQIAAYSLAKFAYDGSGTATFGRSGSIITLTAL